ncbi:MAG: 16S rRNA (cytosine(967)-C(5))-methyltransferase RsmB [Pseudomonadota bacterium]
MNPNTARYLALQLLIAMEDRRFTLDRILEDRQASMDTLDPRDRALVQAIVYGVLRWRSRLDAVIDACLSSPGRRIDPVIRNILRMGIFQLSALDRIPPSAAVHSAVELARASGKKQLAGFVNAVLRQAQRRGVDELLRPPSEDPAAALALEHAIPRWMADRWLARYGNEEASAFCRGINTVAPLVGRVNTLKTTREAVMAALTADGACTAPTTVSPDGLVITGLTGPIAKMPAVAQGHLRIQDEGAQLVTFLLAPKPGETVLDACAGRGGKTGHLAQLMENQGRLLAVDSDVRRLSALAADMLQLGISCVDTLRLDLNHPVPPGTMSAFDRILLDAPCSGMGVIRRNPDTKWTRQPSDLTRYGDRQRRFLSHLAPLVKPSGVLVYAVCSLEAEETTVVVTDFLSRHSAFSLCPPPSSLDLHSRGLVDADGCFRSTPHRHGMDGFFAATFRRNP